MSIQREYRKLEGVEEINIYNLQEKDLFKHVDPIMDMEEIPFKETLKNIPCDLDVFIPYNDGEDFIVQLLGITALERGNIRSADVEGRLLSECSPGFNEILHDIFYDVYKTKQSRKLKFIVLVIENL